MGVESGRQNLFGHVGPAVLDAEFARGEAGLHAVAMTQPFRGAAVAQRPIGFHAARGLGFLRFEADTKEGRGVQRVGRVFFVLEALGEFPVGRLERCQFGAELGGLGAEAGEFFILGRDGREPQPALHLPPLLIDLT